MKLHVYDHCPYCVRVRLALGLKNIPFDLAIHANDDEITPIRMIGRKVLPILEDDDRFMGESLDIIHKIDRLVGEPLFDDEVNSAIASWIGRWQETIHYLVLPRTPDPIFAEFATSQAREYYRVKKEATVGDFKVLLDRTAELITKMQEGLSELETILPEADDPAINGILLFPLLRSLAIVPGLHLPPAVKSYRDDLATRGGIPMPPPLTSSASTP